MGQARGRHAVREVNRGGRFVPRRQLELGRDAPASSQLAESVRQTQPDCCSAQGAALGDGHPAVAAGPSNSEAKAHEG